MVLGILEEQDKLLNALLQLGSGWHTRDDLRRILKKKSRLNPTEVAALEMLVVNGRVERSSMPLSDRPHISQWIYKVR